MTAYIFVKKTKYNKILPMAANKVAKDSARSMQSSFTKINHLNNIQ